MRTSTLLTSLFASCVAAGNAAGQDSAPAPTPEPELNELAPRAKALDPTAPWVSVKKDGTPTTVTPYETEGASGEWEVVSGAPNVLTGSVFTFTNMRDVEVTTSTGDPPLPTARAKNGRGAFVPCHNLNGQYAPFCSPLEGNTVYVGKVYYVTWDPEHPDMKSNVTERFKIKIKGDLNDTSRLDLDEEDPQVFEPSTKHNKLVDWGFYPWHVTKSIIPKGEHNTTIRLKLERYLDEAAWGEEIYGPVVHVVRPPKHQTSSSHPHGDAELYIALPVVFGFVFLVVVGGLIYNRGVRNLGIGNVSGIKRKGYSGRMERASRLLRTGKGRREDEQSIQLLQRDLDDDRYSEDRFRDHEGPSTASSSGNVFRNEVRRQERKLD